MKLLIRRGWLLVAYIVFCYNKVVDKLFLEIEDAPKRGFLNAFVQTGDLMQSCQAVSIDRVTSWRWRKDKVFAEAFKVAEEIYNTNYCNELQLELKKRSLDPKSPMSTVALFFALKAELPDKYREKAPETKLTGDITIKLAIPRPDYTQIIEGEVKELSEGRDNATIEEENEGTKEIGEGK